MSKQDDEIRRLQQLQRRQIAARDPLAKKKALHGRLAEQGRKRKKLSTSKAVIHEWSELPHRWQGAFIGGAAGVLILIVLAAIFQEPWVGPLGLVSIPVLAIVGFLLGTSFDWRDDISDF